MASHNVGRGDSNPPYSRKRSSTVSSVSLFKNISPPQPLECGNSTTLSTWVTDFSAAPVMLNHDFWPGVAEGDMIEVTTQTQSERPGFLFIVQNDTGLTRQTQQQITIAKTIADKFGFINHREVILTKVDKVDYSADYLEITFQDQYLGRSDMWRIGKTLQDQCVYFGQEITFLGSSAGTISSIYIKGIKVASAHVTPSTKVLYRTSSAKTTILIQVCRELWDFAGDGERYYEKIVHSFLPALFSRWHDTGVKHIVTIVLISRVHYDQTEVEYAAGPLRQDDDGRWYKDFYKVITDLETNQDWRPTLVSLKDSFFAFQRDILLTHHYHRAFQMATTILSSVPSNTAASAEVRLVGSLSYAHDGPILEAMNLTLNPSETHYIDRSLSLTGVSTILVTPGTGYFAVPKRLLRSTTLRLLDSGFGLDLVSLAKRPLHSTPTFSFKGEVPELRSHNPEKDGRFGSNGSRELDPLWGGGDGDSLLKTHFWWQPFWISTTFWDQQMDLPFRVDRFVARARMHEIQMLGLLEHDLLSTIEIPYLDVGPEGPTATPESGLDPRNARRMDADNFDLDTFALKKNGASAVAATNRNSIGASSGSAGTIVPSNVTSGLGRDRMPISLSSSASSKFPPIAEDQGQETPVPSPPRSRPVVTPSSPLPILHALEPAEPPTLSTSPSHTSVRSSHSTKTVSSSSSKKTGGTQAQVSLASKLAPGWLFNPFRTSSQPQTSAVSVTSTMTPSQPLIRHSLTPEAPPVVTPMPPKPVSIKNKRSHGGRNQDETIFFTSNRSSFPRTSPLSSSPRDGSETLLALRRSTMSSLTLPPVASSPPRPVINPSRPTSFVSYEQSSMARRWQHIYPTPSFEHQIKWKSLLTPGCLPLTVEHFPTQQELDTAFEYFSYDFVVDPPSMSASFCIKVPGDWKSRRSQEAKDIFALAVMKGQTAIRLAQGFQFILRPRSNPQSRTQEDRYISRRSRSFAAEEEIIPKPSGASEILQNPFAPVYLSMSNEIHRLSYNGEVIKVELYVRRVLSTSKPFDYQCLVWPKLGDGYTEVSTSFRFPGVEKLGWNSMDMVIAGYEQQFNTSSRFWRTRFIVIPTEESPPQMNGSSGERLSDEEIRLAGMDKLADLFGKARWLAPGEKAEAYPAPRFLPTYLGPAASTSDDTIISQLEEIHASGPLKKKKNSEKVLQEYPLAAIAKSMRDDDGVPIKDHKWHGALYPDSFTGAELTSWLVREFSDVSTREQAAEAGSRLHAQGLFEHCRKHHGFLDGHYYYRFKAEFATPRSPRNTIWSFRGRHAQPEERIVDRANSTSSDSPISGRGPMFPPRRYKKRLVLSQTMVIDADLNKRSDFAETATLHHDIIHNPATALHFELNWISTSARCLEELIRQWSRSIEKYGLRLVEGFVDQITDIRDKNMFQSCFPIRLAVPPPVLKRSSDSFNMAFEIYFESMLLKKFGFVIDVEAQHRYSDQVDVFYSYRRSSYKYTQYVHQSGAAFVQVIGGQEGFRFLTNRLMAPGRLGSTRGVPGKTPSQMADSIRDRLNAFCSDPVALAAFYEEIQKTIPDDDIEFLAI